MSNTKEFIAKKVAKYFKAGDVVNLGIGIPTLVGNYIEEGVLLHTENGLLGYGGSPEPGKEDDDFTGAGAQYLTLVEGASTFDSATSFAIVRGGHLAATVLGALEVDEMGNIANWSRPGKIVGMGGAMDLVNGARQVIVAMEHTAKGNPKILKKCKLPLTGAGVVTKIVTELCVIDVTKEGLKLSEIAEGVTIDEVIAKTDAKLIIPENISIM
ncbi:3-oxoacid CoA-transferase subunit B [Clostridium sp. SYSU_GA19001]|uniref:3-oxoacid CoA-transferase subunit B n=1 Tax=Clostridium caldaquaticum TaxID=2940653 RepID=UPI0020776264|nr:3-oxoacid CoA-transferase subunit B [Clostridium caldaquaticum]MCM8711247.1 3-oxoacid CoA-transferase subunit B [Clostridium caldaquaticum]